MLSSITLDLGTEAPALIESLEKCHQSFWSQDSFTLLRNTKDPKEFLSMFIFLALFTILEIKTKAFIKYLLIHFKIKVIDLLYATINIFMKNNPISSNKNNLVRSIWLNRR